MPYQTRQHPPLPSLADEPARSPSSTSQRLAAGARRNPVEVASAAATGLIAAAAALMHEVNAAGDQRVVLMVAACFIAAVIFAVGVVRWSTHQDDLKRRLKESNENRAEERHTEVMDGFQMSYQRIGADVGEMKTQLAAVAKDVADIKASNQHPVLRSVKP